jgi:ankyrin repeat protein
MLLAAGAAPNMVHATVNAESPLHCAADIASDCELELFLALLAAGAKVDQQTKQGQTPVFFAAHGGREDIVKALVDAGANTQVHAVICSCMYVHEVGLKE